jgi:cytochrome b561
MDFAVRLVRLAQIGMLASIALYVAAGEMLKLKVSGNPANALFHALSFISISLVGATVVVRRTLVLPSETLLLRSEDSLTVKRWQTGHLLLYALCEVLGLFGLILRIDGFTLGNVWGFYLGAFLLLLLYSPRPPQPDFRRRL